MFASCTLKLTKLRMQHPSGPLEMKNGTIGIYSLPGAGLTGAGIFFFDFAEDVVLLATTTSDWILCRDDGLS